MSLQTVKHFTDIIKVNVVSYGSLTFAQFLPQFHAVNDAIQAVGSTVIIIATALYTCLKLFKAFKKKAE